jgi:hypothetical protein
MVFGYGMLWEPQSKIANSAALNPLLCESVFMGMNGWVPFAVVHGEVVTSSPRACTGSRAAMCTQLGCLRTRNITVHVMCRAVPHGESHGDEAWAR